MPDFQPRWIRRFESYRQALRQLGVASDTAQTRKLSDLEQQGLIQAFEYTQELAWKLLQDFLKWQGMVDWAGPRDVLRAAFLRGLIRDGETWMDTLRSRNLTVHTYNEALARQIAASILNAYYPLFIQLERDMQQHLPDSPGLPDPAEHDG